MRGGVVGRAALGLCALGVSACAYTAPATNVASNSAIFHAKGFYDGSAAHLYFEYSTNQADIGTSSAQRTATTNLPAQPAGTPGSLDVPVTGLAPDTQYYYDACGADAQWNVNGGDFCDGSQHTLVTLPTPTALAIDAPLVTGTISTPGHSAAFSFTGKAGDVVAALVGNGGTLAVSTAVQDASGNQIPGNPSNGEYTLPADGTYTVVAADGGATGSFDLGVYDNSRLTVTADGPTVDVPVLGGESTTVSFTGTAGSQISGTVNGPLTNFYGGAYPTMTLEDAAGNQINNDAVSVPASFGPWTLPTTGTYQLVFSSNGTTTLGSLSLAESSPTGGK